MASRDSRITLDIRIHRHQMQGRPTAHIRISSSIAYASLSGHKLNQILRLLARQMAEIIILVLLAR